MTQDEKVARLSGGPFYAESAYIDYLLNTPLTDDQVQKECDATMQKMARELSERHLRFIKCLILYGEKAQAKRLAGVLAGMTPKARAKWIEENST